MRPNWKLFFICVAALSGLCFCQPRTVIVERGATKVVTRQIVSTIVVTVEATVLVTRQATVAVPMTPTPTPVPQGGYVTRATFADAQTVNPAMAADDASRELCRFLFEGLLRTDPFTGVLEPNLATNWQVSADGLTYTFHIRRGLLWSDGRPITAHDFYFTYAALLSGKLDTANNKLVANIVKIEVPDDYTAVVTFASADCSNLQSLTLGWLPMHVFTDDVDDYDFGELAMHEFNSTPTVFSGPFKLQEWVRGDHWTLVRNERYWRGAPYLDGLINLVLNGQEELAKQLKEGRVDVGIGIEPAYLAELESEPHLQIFKLPADEYDFIGFQLGNPDDPQPRLNKNGELNSRHGRHPILHDVRVRQAIACALDRRELLSRARMGQGTLLNANVLPVISWAYNAELPPRERDLQRAAHLLDEAGWKLDPATGIREKKGRPLKLQLYTNAGNEVRETMGLLIKKQLREVGIEIEFNAVEWYSFLDILFGQTFDMVLVSWSNLGADPDDLRLWSAQEDVPGRGYNFVSYYNPTVEEKLAQARAVPRCDQDERARLYRQVQAILYKELPYCWLDEPRRLVAVDRRIGGVNPGPWDLWYNVHEWYIGD